MMRPALTGIDTNVLLRFLLGDDTQQSPVAEEVFAALTPENPGFITQITLVETYWILVRGRKLPKRDCLAIIRRLLETDCLEFDDGEAVVRALTLAEDGADFPDALIASTAEFFGVDRMVTFDRQTAAKLDWELLSDD